MARPDEGLRNEELRAAIPTALAGQPQRLEELLARFGTTPSGRPNLQLAAAFGAELAQAAPSPARLLMRLGDDDSAPDMPRVFLPVAAAHGWTSCIRAQREVEAGWHALAALAADERVPVRLGTLDALVTLSARNQGADAFIERANEWLGHEDREIRYGAMALAIEIIGLNKILAAISDPDAMLTYLSRAIDEISDAPRAAERLESRRRALTSLSQTLAPIVASVRAAERGLLWLDGECARAKHPDVRRSLSDTVSRLPTIAHAPRTHAIDAIRASLEGSAKPLRDPTLLRPGTGRGKRSRRTR
jgi:hypothetical protein